MAGVAFTINSSIIGKSAKFGGKVPWQISAYSTDIITDVQTLRAKPSGKYQYLKSIGISCEALATGETISIFDGADLVIGPIPTLGEWNYVFDAPMKFELAIGLSSTATHPICVIAEGFDA